MDKTLVFYAGLLYGEYAVVGDLRFRRHTIKDLPDGAYIRYSDGEWYRSDYTPVLPEDIPKELLLLTLLLT